MLKVIPRVIAFAAIVGTVASCSEEDPQPSARAQRCDQLSRAACAVFVRCRALVDETDGVWSNDLCNQIVPNVAADCTTDPGNDAVGTASDAEINACISAYEAFPCAELCGRVVMDPAACQALDTAASPTAVECAP